MKASVLCHQAIPRRCLSPGVQLRYQRPLSTAYALWSIQFLFLEQMGCSLKANFSALVALKTAKGVGSVWQSQAYGSSAVNAMIQYLPERLCNKLRWWLISSCCFLDVPLEEDHSSHKIAFKYNHKCFPLSIILNLLLWSCMEAFCYIAKLRSLKLLKCTQGMCTKFFSNRALDLS